MALHCRDAWKRPGFAHFPLGVSARGWRADRGEYSIGRALRSP
jgi:hypothetical protein